MKDDAQILRTALIVREVRREIVSNGRNKAALVRALVEECRRLGARFRILPTFDSDGAQRWSFTAPTNLPRCRQHLLEAATFFGGGWVSSRDMGPRAQIRFGDVRFNAAFVQAIRGGRS